MNYPFDCHLHDNYTPLHLAALDGSAETVELLLDAKADVNANTGVSVVVGK